MPLPPAHACCSANAMYTRMNSGSEVKTAFTMTSGSSAAVALGTLKPLALDPDFLELLVAIRDTTGREQLANLQALYA